MASLKQCPDTKPQFVRSLLNRNLERDGIPGERLVETFGGTRSREPGIPERSSGGTSSRTSRSIPPDRVARRRGSRIRSMAGCLRSAKAAVGAFPAIRALAHGGSCPDMDDFALLDSTAKDPGSRHV